jgi:hypothetical protein
MNFGKKLTHYVSDIDQFLADFDRTHSQLSKTQQKERDKYQRINDLRDVVNRPDSTQKLPKDF